VWFFIHATSVSISGYCSSKVLTDCGGVRTLPPQSAWTNHEILIRRALQTTLCHILLLTLATDLLAHSKPVSRRRITVSVGLIFRRAVSTTMTQMR
jgi:hypothetical protein